jgi:hypothetical protein
MDMHQRRRWFDRRSLLFMHLQGKKCMHVISILYRVYTESSFSLYDGEHLKINYTSSCCCSPLSLRNMPPATTRLNNIHRPCQPYSLSACHLSMLHHHGLTRTALCLKKIYDQNRIPSCSSSQPE